LDKIQTDLQNGNLASLQTLDAAGLLDKINSMQNWSELDPATKSSLNELAGKLQEAQQLLADNNMTQAEKESAADKLASDIKTLAGKAKSDLASMLEMLKELLGIFKIAAKELRTTYLGNVSTLTSELAEKGASLSSYIKANNEILISGAVTTTSDNSVFFNVLKAPDNLIQDKDFKQLSETYKAKEKEYNKARIVLILTDENISDEEYKLLVADLGKDGKTLVDYISEKRKDGKSDDELVADVKQSLGELIDKILDEKIYGNVQ
jgi:uncharacterized protein YjbJ (UPF0337 family)